MMTAIKLTVACRSSLFPPSLLCASDLPATWRYINVDFIWFLFSVPETTRSRHSICNKAHQFQGQGHQIDYCWDLNCIISTEQEGLRTSKLVRRWSMRYQLPRPAISAYEVGFLRAGAYRVGRTRWPHNLFVSGTQARGIILRIWLGAQSMHPKRVLMICFLLWVILIRTLTVPYFTPKPFWICPWHLCWNLTLDRLVVLFSLIFSFGYTLCVKFIVSEEKDLLRGWKFIWELVIWSGLARLNRLI